MKAITFHLAALLVAALFTVALNAQVENIDPNGGGGGGGSSCNVCRGTWWGNGVMQLSCGSPDPGGWGRDHCSVDSYPEGTYCQAYGNDCCVD